MSRPFGHNCYRLLDPFKDPNYRFNMFNIKVSKIKYQIVLDFFHRWETLNQLNEYFGTIKQSTSFFFGQVDNKNSNPSNIWALAIEISINDLNPCQ